MSEGNYQISLAQEEAKLKLAEFDDVVKALGSIEETATKFRDIEGYLQYLGGTTDITLRKRMAYWLLILFSVNTGGALLMILLVGLGKIISFR